MSDGPKHMLPAVDGPRHMAVSEEEPILEESCVGEDSLGERTLEEEAPLEERNYPTEDPSSSLPADDWTMGRMLVEDSPAVPAVVGERPMGAPSFEDEPNEPEVPKELPLWLDLTITMLVTVAVMLFVRRFVLDAYKVPTGSMLNTIQLGDMLFGEKLSYYLRDPQPGEVVTFDDPSNPSITLIKRVIATEGQTVELVDGVVVVDGQALDEPYVEGRPSDPIYRHASNLDADVTYPFVVPEGCVWVMGDNRTNSLDSRYFGAVRVSAVSSHAVYIYWPPSDMGTL